MKTGKGAYLPREYGKEAFLLKRGWTKVFQTMTSWKKYKLSHIKL